jgi:pilus assembly protein CpaF
MTVPLTAYEALRERVHGVLAARDVDPAEVGEGLRLLVETEVERFQRDAMAGKGSFEPFARPDEVLVRLLRDVSGLSSQIEALLADPDVEEIYGTDGELTYRTVTGDTRVVEPPLPAVAVCNLVQRWASSAGEQLDAAHPKVDGVRVTLPGPRQARLQASIPPRIDGTVAFTLRLPQKRNTTLDDLVVFDSISRDALEFLSVLMTAARVKVLVVGPPGAGKTTVIEALLRAVPPWRRTIVAEENRELSAPLLNGEYWQTSKVESLYDLIRSARVASPDLIVLGELKGAEAWELAMAANLGTGCIAAVHADSASEAFDALAVAASSAVPAMGRGELRSLFAEMFDVVIFTDKDDSGAMTLRQVTEISVVPPQLGSGGVAVNPIFARREIGSPMELVSTAVGDRLERKCNRVLRHQRTRLHEVLSGGMGGS